MIGNDIRVVLFDHDDTLVGTIAAKWKQHKFVAKKHYGKDLTDDELRQHWGVPLTELVTYLYDTPNGKKALEVYFQYEAENIKQLFVSTEALLQRLHGEGKILGVVTATTRNSFDFDVETTGLPAHLFDIVQTEDDTSHHKPDPRVFDQIIDKLSDNGVSPREVLYIGDGWRDHQAAIGAGFDFIGVGTGLVSTDDFRAKNIKAVSSLEEL